MRVASPLVVVEVDLPVAAQLLARQRLAGGAHGDRPGALRVAVERLLRQAVPLHENRQSVIEGLIPGELVQRRRPVRFDRRTKNLKLVKPEVKFKTVHKAPRLLLSPSFFHLSEILRKRK